MSSPPRNRARWLIVAVMVAGLPRAPPSARRRQRHAGSTGECRPWRAALVAVVSAIAFASALSCAGCYDFGALAPVDGGDDPCAASSVTSGPGILVAGCVIGAPPLIDGKLDDWSAAAFTVLDRANAAFVDGTASFTGTTAIDDADSSGSFAVRWDLNALYVAVKVTDDVRGLHPTETHYWLDDAVEVFLDGDGARTAGYNSDDHQLIVRADGQMQETRNEIPVPLPPGTVVAVAVASGGAASWTLELAVPFADLGDAAVHGGRELGFDLLIDDDDSLNTSDRKHLLGWVNLLAGASPCPAPYCSTAAFGRVVLGGR